MKGEDEANTISTPFLVQVIAGLDLLIMLAVSLAGVIVVLISPNLPIMLQELQVTDPTTYAELLTLLENLNITLDLLILLVFTFGIIFIVVGLIGILFAVGTLSRKSWALALGLIVSLIAIFGSIFDHLIFTLFPYLITSQTFLVITIFSVFSATITINVLLLGVFILWQLPLLEGKQASIGRFILLWNLDAISLVIIVLLVDGIFMVTRGSLSFLGLAYVVVAFISGINLLVRPVFTRLVAQAARWWLGFSLSFILIFFLNAAIIYIVSLLIPDFVVVGLFAALLGSLAMSAVNTFFVSVVGLDDDNSFYNYFIRKQIAEKIEEADIPQTRGIVVLEIDGLSYTALEEALKRGYMPTLQSIISSGSHKLVKWDCGIPSMTSSCQAGILYGNNHDIPAFRWYAKPENRMIVSNRVRDANFIDQRASSGNGLLRGGSSVSNLLSGDATYSFFTMSTLTEENSRAGRRRSEDIYLYLLNPYVLNRSIISTVWDVLVELGQSIKQWITRRKPRMNRVAHGYPFVRAVTNIFMRDIVTGLVSQDIFRGSPAIYATYLGYDEIAHHSGPLSGDALKALRGIEKQIRRIKQVIEQNAPRPYDLFILADHGQSMGWTFKQRYNQSLKDTIADLLEGKAKVGEVEAFDAHRGYISGLITDLSEGQQKANQKGPIDGRIRISSSFFERQIQKTTRKQGPYPPERTEKQAADDVIVCASGNLAQIYFNFKQERVTLEELESKFPGFLANLVSHEGVGFAIVTDADDGPMLLGKEGAVQLQTNQIHGINPLTPFGREDIRIKQLLRLAEYPSCGDIILISPVYPDGSVAAYEELIGNHGGIGGFQTESFLLHPSDMQVDGDTITDSSQVFPILNRRRPS